MGNKEQDMTHKTRLAGVIVELVFGVGYLTKETSTVCGVTGSMSHLHIDDGEWGKNSLEEHFVGGIEQVCRR